ncbi:type III-A CRISPR-associated RAMP protein Csm5 [Candidatus Poribacteria bacterium]|nr:type III-A CRISPR-associated RAMP protein Csm5 [Candidatus Poribacteria bacterium]
MKYELKTITPVHVGTGEKLSQIDGFYADRLWYRVNLDPVLTELPESKLNQLTVQMGQRGFRWQKHFEGLDLTGDRFCAYALACPEDPGETEIREAIKDVFNRPMIPGSSIKGAIRTAVILHLLYSSDSTFDRAVKRLKDSVESGDRGRPRSPSPSIEKGILGDSANEDLLRTVQISDTETGEIKALEMGVVWTVTLDNRNQLVKKIDRGREYKVFVEQVRSGQSLEFSIKIDDLLFKDPAKRRLNFTDQQEKAIREIPAACNQLTIDTIDREIEFNSNYNLPEMVNFYESLHSKLERLPEGAFILCLGWGTGHHTKTVLNSLVEDEEDAADLMMKIRQHYHLGESRSRRGSYDERAFPKTRRILYEGQKPKYPLGWVQVTPL